MNMEFIANIFSKNINLKYHGMVIVVFSFLYYMLSISGIAAENEEEQFDDLGSCIYYTIVTHFTIGYGDISPKSRLFRALCCIQILCAFMLTNL